MLEKYSHLWTCRLDAKSQPLFLAPEMTDVDNDCNKKFLSVNRLY